MKKKRIIGVAVAVAVLLLILFLPIQTAFCNDGGTRIYSALTYTVVVWNRIQESPVAYHKTSVFWFPENRKSIDELWEIEKYGR